MLVLPKFISFLFGSVVSDNTGILVTVSANLRGLWNRGAPT